MFLTAEQLVELTGYQKPSAQIKWLRTQGLRHWVRADGRPAVPVAAIDGPEPTQVRPQPNFAAIRKGG